MNKKNINIEFYWHKKIEIANNKSKGLYNLEIKFNYELFYFLLNNKREFIISHLNTDKKCLQFNVNNSEDEIYINKIISCNNFFILKTVFMFDIKKYINKCLPNVECEIIDYKSIINLKSCYYYNNNNLNKDYINNVLYNVHNFYFNLLPLDGWRDYKNRDYFFIYKILLNKYSEIDINRLNNLVDATLIPFENFFSKILIINK